jgi:RNA-directed DNA polymerase
MKNVLSLSPKEAREFFLDQQSYCNFDIPEYFKFQDLLNDLSLKLGSKKISEFCGSKKPSDFDDVNYRLASNKDGKYAWRPLQLIHPLLYVNLVHLITETSNWKIIVARLNELRRTGGKIKCESLPVIDRRYKRNKAGQISHWIEHVEKQSIQYAIEYDYLLKTDITDCYGAIYTHSIAWALHGKDVAKAGKGKATLLGDIIDKELRSMSYGQTNGIPQGSDLMDFIAELVLCYADSLIFERIKKLQYTRSDYKIIRYRDDYRIFTQNSQTADQILKVITDVLYGLGMKINSSKTRGSDNIVHASIKEDKLSWIAYGINQNDPIKELISVSIFAEKFPNSGQLTKMLRDYIDRIDNLRKADFKNNPMIAISVVVDIAFKNPRIYPLAAAIISKFIDFLPQYEKLPLLHKILDKFEKLPNAGIMQIWLQRIKIKIDSASATEDGLCQKVVDKNTKIWNSDWLKQSIKNQIDICDLVDNEVLNKMGAVISKNEVELFRLTEHSF